MAHDADRVGGGGAGDREDAVAERNGSRGGAGALHLQQIEAGSARWVPDKENVVSRRENRAEELIRGADDAAEGCVESAVGVDARQGAAGDGEEFSIARGDDVACRPGRRKVELGLVLDGI